MFPKEKRIRITGKKIKDLNTRIWARDNGVCVICGYYVDPDEKFHHEPPKSQGGQDIEENGVMLCYSCHNQRHGGKNSIEIKNQCEWYLKKMYCVDQDTPCCRDCECLLCEYAWKE